MQKKIKAFRQCNKTRTGRRLDQGTGLMSHWLNQWVIGWTVWTVYIFIIKITYVWYLLFLYEKKLVD